MNTTISTIQLTSGEINLDSMTAQSRLANLGFTAQSLQEAITAHSVNEDAPALYVGTYAKYNAGSLCGMWVNLASFDSFSEFQNFCFAIHCDEDYPELMFQDFQGFPREFYSECGFNEKAFDKIKEIALLTESYGKQAVEDFFEHFVIEDLCNFEEFYCGEYDSEISFAESLAQEVFSEEQRESTMFQYFDYEAFARDLFFSDYYCGSNGFVFRRA